MLGTKMMKSEFEPNKYAKLASWCNSQQYKTIEDKGDYYEVVDCTPTQEELNAQERITIQNEIAQITNELAQVNGASICATESAEYDIIKGGELVTMSENEMQDYYIELVNKRSELVAKYKELK